MVPVRSALALALGLAASSSALAWDQASLDAALRERLDGDRTGACVAVAVIGKEQVLRSRACADPAQIDRIADDPAFEIGSVSKTMTATLLARMIAAGEASLDDPLADWLPEGSRVPAFQGQPILLRHLVTHTSGLPVLPPGTALGAQDPYAAIDAGELLAALARTELTRAPGAAFEYSNFASMLLSMVVARRAGIGFETLLQRDLLQPLGMENSYVNRRPEGLRAAAGHDGNGQEVPAWTFRDEAAGVGGVRATLDDMVRYARAQLGEAPAPLAAAIELTQQPVTGVQGRPMGMNWMMAPLNGRQWHVHEGATAGFSSFVAFDREAGRAVVALSDTSFSSVGGLGSLALHLMDPQVPLGQPRRSVPAPADLLDGLAGEYQLQNGMRMQLSRQGDRLVVQPEGQPAFEMGYDSAGDFHPLAFDALLRPQRRAGGGYGFQWHQLGGVLEATPLAPAKAEAYRPDPATLQDYVGEYPLVPGFALSISVVNGVLHVQGTGQSPLAATAVAPDVFAVEAVGAEVRFERDGEGRVSAVSLHQGGQVLRGPRN